MTLKTAHAFASAGLDPGLADTAGGWEGGGIYIGTLSSTPLSCPLVCQLVET